MRTTSPTRLLVLALSLAAGAAGAADRGWLQPSAEQEDLRVAARNGTAEVVDPSGRRIRTRLRGNEVLLRVAGTESGWFGAGIRYRRDGLVDLVMVENGRRLRPPAGAVTVLSRTGPAPIVADGRLVAAAWLEGALGAPLAVRVAARSEHGWQAPVTVSLPSAGSQTGLSAVALAPDRWLLAWSRYDGEDDEIVWSVGSGSAWSPVRRVHEGNRTPDIAPRLTRTPDGALLVWSRLEDGEYRVLSRAFGADGWAATEHRLSGPGGVFPTPAGPEVDPYVVYRDARHGTWSVVDLELDGSPIRRAHGIESEGRPALAFAGFSSPRVVAADSDQPKTLAWEPVP